MKSFATPTFWLANHYNIIYDSEYMFGKERRATEWSIVGDIAAPVDVAEEDFVEEVDEDLEEGLVEERSI